MSTRTNNTITAAGAITTNGRCADLYARAVELMPGGVSRNTVLRDPHPIYVDYGSYAKLRGKIRMGE